MTEKTNIFNGANVVKYWPVLVLSIAGASGYVVSKVNEESLYRKSADEKLQQRVNVIDEDIKEIKIDVKEIRSGITEILIKLGP